MGRISGEVAKQHGPGRNAPARNERGAVFTGRAFSLGEIRAAQRPEASPR